MERSTYFGNSWIGMFVKTNNSVSFLPIDSTPKLESSVSNVLGTTIIKTTVAESNLIGLYTAMNSNGIILPNIVTQKEIDLIKKTGLNVCISTEKHNAHGNNLAVNDKGGIINPNVSSLEIRAMQDALGVELVPYTIAGHTTVGSACIATNEGFLAHYRATSEELDFIKSILKVSGGKGTMNTGSGFVSYGVIVNKNGYVAGEDTTSFELGRLEEALGLIK